MIAASRPKSPLPERGAAVRTGFTLGRVVSCRLNWLVNGFMERTRIGLWCRRFVTAMPTFKGSALMSRCAADAAAIPL